MNTSGYPLVSISIPAYNHEKYVQEAIQSVIDQDYPRIELIVIDDGSKDSTWSKIEEMRTACEKRFERVVMRTRDNKGRVATGSELLSEARGDYLGYLASDDRYLPQAISVLVEAMIENLDVGMTVGVNRIVDADGRRCYWDNDRNIVYDESAAVYRTFDDFIFGYSHVDFDGEEFGSYSKLAINNHLPNGQLVRRSIYSQIVPFHPEAPLEDWWFNLQVAKVSKIRHVPVETFCYRWHGANTVTQKEYMDRIWGETMLCERKFLIKAGDFKRLNCFSYAYPQRNRVAEFWIGKHHCPHIDRIRNLDSTQFRMRIGRFDFPLTPKLPW